MFAISGDGGIDGEGLPDAADLLVPANQFLGEAMQRSNRRILFVARAMSELSIREWRELNEEIRREWFGKARRALVAGDRFDERQNEGSSKGDALTDARAAAD